MNAYNNSLRSRLPHAYPFVFVDRVIDYRQGKNIVCIKNLTSSENIFYRDLDHNLIFPSSLVVEAMAQASGILIESTEPRPAYLSLLRGFRFFKPVECGDQLVIKSFMFHKFDSLYVFETEASVNGEKKAVGQITLALIP